MISFKKFAFGITSALLIGASLSFAATQMSNSNSASKSSKSTATSSHQGSSAMAITDRHFVKKAAEGGLAEVELGKLATEKASNDQVKQFGQKMVDDHSKANDELKQIASKESINLPTEPSPQEKAQIARLSKLSGEPFDRAYMADMRNDHEKDVADFRMESKSGHDPEIKNFAAQTLPTLEDHLKQAKSIKPAKTSSQRSSLDKSNLPKR